MSALKSWWRRTRPRLLGKPISVLVRVLSKTLRLETPGLEEMHKLETGVIACGWHGRTILAAMTLRHRGWTTIISLSNDGEMQNRVFTSLGFTTIRGSTGRGGVKVLVESIKALKAKGKLALSPDGPRGPSGEVQAGLLMMAKKSGAAIVPTAASASRRWLAPTWDRYMVPLPFSRAIMVYGDPIYVPSDATDEDIEKLRAHLEEVLHRMEQEAEDRMGVPPEKRHTHSGSRV